MVLNLKFFLALVSLIQICFPSVQTNEGIIGKWYCISNNNGLIYEFQSDNYFSICKPNSPLKIEGKFEVDYDSNKIIVYGEGIPIHYTFQFEHDQLILIDYKIFTGQIGHYALLKKVNSPTDSVTTNISTDRGQQIVLPYLFHGLAYICYNQNDGSEKVYTSDNIPLIHIPTNGFLQTQFKEDPFNFIKGNISFLTNDTNNIWHKIPSFQFDKYIDKYEELVNQGFKEDSVYVCLYGYNRDRRIDINKQFKKIIEGNILFFKVDTLKNLMYNPYEYTYLKK